MKRCFISHCSDDKEPIVEPLQELLTKNFDRDQYRFFCSSVANSALSPGDELSSALKTEIKESDCMIAIVTDGYLRSPICLTELSAMWYKSDKKGITSIIPIVFTPSGASFFQHEFVSNIIYLDATQSIFSRDNAEILTKGLEANDFFSNGRTSLLSSLTEFLQINRQRLSLRPYIGSRDVFFRINEFCAKGGVKEITAGAVNHNEVCKHLAGKQTLYFVMTTGSSFIDIYSKEFLQSQISQGTTVYMILPNRNSDFCIDVATIESPNHSEDNLKRLSAEFDSVVRKLKIVLHEAESLAIEPDRIGHVFLCAAYTLLRQTICMAKSNDGDCWGWITTTLPPVRASGNTPTLVFEGNLNNSSFFGNSVYQHVHKLIELARNRGGLIDLAQNPSFISFDRDSIVDSGERAEKEKEWQEKYLEACKVMCRRQRTKKRILIEIAAQHPLNGDKPGNEFRARLDYGFRLYQSLCQDEKVEEVSIYVPGSVHMEHGIVDPVSLSEAGCQYLLELGIPKDSLFGDKENHEYMTINDVYYGVYNSCDECFVSSRLFYDIGYTELHCVCSPNQALRKQLFYLNFKVIPVMHTVRTDEMYHDFTQELFHSVPNVLYRYPNWSTIECPIFWKSRRERMPEFKQK